MSFELKPTHELVQIAAAGGGFTLKAGLKPTHELVQIAAAARGSGARVTFTGLSLRPTHELVQIAAAGKGVVTLEG
jgi:hypothetical protein